MTGVPDGGDCVLAAPLTCGKLTPQQLGSRPRIIFDTDAQFRGDPTTSRRREQGAFGDTSALIYLLLRSDKLQLLGVTTSNANGGSIDDQVSEVERVAALTGSLDLPVRRGAVGTYTELATELDEPSFDGAEAVDFIISKAEIATPIDPIVIILGGKATNLALALTKEPSIAPNIVVHWLATDEPGAAEQPGFPTQGRSGGSGMYNIINDPEAANYVLSAPIALHLLRAWSIVLPSPATEPRYSGGVAGLRIKQAADLPCTGPRVEPVSFPDGSEFWTAGSYVKTSFTTFGGNGVRSLDEANLGVLLVRPELATTRTVPAPYYDTTLEELVYPESGAHQVFLYDAIETQTVSEEFVGALFNPFVSCEWR